MRQTRFAFAKESRLFHGGELACGKRKTLRPLSSKRPIHLVLKARKNLYREKLIVLSILKKQSAASGVLVYSAAVNVDHVHLVLKIPCRRQYARFIRALTGLLARKLGKKLWTLAPFTRVTAWGRDFRGLLAYLEKNRREVDGEIPYEPRRELYRRFRKASPPVDRLRSAK